MTVFDEQDGLPFASDLSEGSARDFMRLLKPRVMQLVVFTAITGMVLAPGTIHPLIGLVAIVCIAVGAGAAGALNMWYDADIDGVMTRTAGRPVPSGRIRPGEALAFGLVLAFFSVMTLGLAVNWFSAAFLAFTIVFYVVVYTAWLKRLTPQNIVIGGAAGAFPPMIGWACVTGSVSLDSFVLFLIVFLWTPPHFWALALFKLRDYGSAGVPMLPNVAGEAATKRQILGYSVVMAASAVAPAVLGFASPVYGLVAVVAGAVFVHRAWQVFRMPEGDRAMVPAKRLFGYSLVYLAIIFGALLLDHLGVAVLRASGVL
ncbi:heme o synthase [Pararhizobium mangrovi]|uniref:Protoheme IX farnesyltransferase n=1 Tax=Pararhizobium mangrovi TaxID=2590452 RepID=A0A506U5H7_9HYPH|nr:heme o synthase [Pararhizobium mangrovi]TPW28708.1 protoheme IX farnesyltransferase [Pararhizobium mangrovi]